MDFDLIGNAMDSLNEAIDYYKYGKDNNDESRFKYCVLLLAHSAELILKEILYNEHEILLFENIDDVKDNNPQTVGFKQAIKRVKSICKIDLRGYATYLTELVNLRNQIQHYKFQISQQYCNKIIVQSFSAIEYIVMDILEKTFDEFGDYISAEQIEFLHEDKDVYTKRKQDIAKDIKDNNLKKIAIEYKSSKFIYIPCPNCAETTLVQKDHEITCKFCGNKYDSIKSIYIDDYNGIIQDYMNREIGRKKHLFSSEVFECKECNSDALIYTDKWKCLSCGFEIKDTIICDDCGKDIPDSKYNYVIAQAYYDADDFCYLCKGCGKKLKESERGFEYEIS